VRWHTDRAFRRRFSLADYVRVASANLNGGLLSIDLVRELPEAMRPRRIEIANSNQPQVTVVPRDSKVVRSTTHRLAGLVGRRAGVAQPWGDQTGGAGFYPPLWSRRASFNMIADAV
jgi:hypothetical protein